MYASLNFVSTNLSPIANFVNNWKNWKVEQKTNICFLSTPPRLIQLYIKVNSAYKWYKFKPMRRPSSTLFQPISSVCFQSPNRIVKLPISI